MSDVDPIEMAERAVKHIAAVHNLVGRARDELTLLRHTYTHATHAPKTSEQHDELDAALSSLNRFALGFAADCYRAGMRLALDATEGES